MTKPSFEEAKALSKTGEYQLVPVSREIPSAGMTPLDILRKLKKVSRHCYLLESVEKNRTWGRYTFLGFDPKLEFTCTDGRMQIQAGTPITPDAKGPSDMLRTILAENRSPRFDFLPTFTGGLVGYFSYDYLKYAEPSLTLDTKNEENFKDVDLMLFDKVIAFDNFRQVIVLIVNVRCGEIETEYSRGEMELRNLEALILRGVPQENIPGRMTSPLTPLFDKEMYCSLVEQAKGHIQEGDIFQVVLSNRLSADFTGSLLDTYRILRETNPSPYMFYFSGQDLEIAGASPETLVKLEDGVLHTFPLAGTRPRGSTPVEDRRLREELLADEKERAEHNMLVDLGRNDLGKISRFGSVSVEKYMEIEHFSHVMHIGSTIRGEIRPDCDALSAVEAVLPAGTLSGAPKLRACEIIQDLEHHKRGIYGGAIGYLDFTGNLDTCIAIRMAYKKNNKVFVCAGAGIVADSVPENEYQECINKAKAVVNALTTAQEEAQP